MRRRDWAQVYSTVHVSPVWLGGWRRGPVGVTTEAGVCEGWEEGGGVVRGGEVKEEGEEEKDRGKGGPSTCPGPKRAPLSHQMAPVSYLMLSPQHLLWDLP